VVKDSRFVCFFNLFAFKCDEHNLASGDSQTLRSVKIFNLTMSGVGLCVCVSELPQMKHSFVCNDTLCMYSILDESRVWVAKKLRCVCEGDGDGDGGGDKEGDGENEVVGENSPERRRRSTADVSSRSRERGEISASSTENRDADNAEGDRAAHKEIKNKFHAFTRTLEHDHEAPGGVRNTSSLCTGVDMLGEWRKCEVSFSAALRSVVPRSSPSLFCASSAAHDARGNEKLEFSRELFHNPSSAELALKLLLDKQYCEHTDAREKCARLTCLALWQIAK
jgi:hypothetical protein